MQIARRLAVILGVPATLALLPVSVGAAPDRPPAEVTVTNTPNVVVVQERFQVAGTVSTATGCTSSLVADVPAGRTVVITSIDAGAEDTIKPAIVVWTRQRSGGGFFTHFRGIPLESFTGSGPTLFSGTLWMKHRIVPGSFTSGDLFDMLICIEPGPGDASASGAFIVSGFLD